MNKYLQTQEPLSKNRKLYIFCLLSFLVISVLRTNYGIWDAPVPFGDETTYIQESFELNKQERYSTNFYINTYILIFKFFTSDAVKAHHIIRVFSTLLSVIGLFLFLSVLPGVNLFTAYIFALLWGLNLSNTPVTQFGNINVFALSLACFAGYIGLRSKVKYLSLVLLVVTFLTRHEYIICFALCGLYLFINWYSSANWLSLLRQSKTTLLHFVALLAILLILLTPFFMSSSLRQRVYDTAKYADNYLFLGLSQCYTAYTLRNTSLIDIHWATDFDIIMEKTFPGAKGFLDAVIINPLEIIKYFSFNSLYNISKLYRVLLHHSIILPTNLHFHPKNVFLLLEGIVLLAFFALGGIWLVGKHIKQLSSFGYRTLWEDEHLVFVIGLSLVTVPAMIYLIPDPRYWLSLVPLLYWGPAAFSERFFRVVSAKSGLIIAVVSMLIIYNPVFSSALNRRANVQGELIEVLGHSIELSGKDRIKIIGWWPDSLCAYAVPGKCDSTNIWEIPALSSFELLIKEGNYDFVVIDKALRTTRAYKKEVSFFEKLILQPQGFGYEVIFRDRDGETVVFQSKNE